MKKRFWMAAAACFVLAAVCILLPSPWGWLRTTLTILSVPLLVGGMLLVVNALLPAHVLPVLGLDEPEHAPVPVPPPPSLPQNLPVEQRVIYCRAVGSPSLMFELSNPCCEPVVFDGQGLPVAQSQGHGLGVQSIAAFCKKNGAVCRFELADGTFLLQLVL